LHYTMLGMENKLAIPVHRHPWDVPPKRAVAIQEELRKYWIGEDRFRKIRTVAGLDVAFVLVGPQALRRGVDQSNALRNANQAIGSVVEYEYPEMLEIERTYAILPLRFPYVPGLLSFREIPVLLAALAKLKHLPDLMFCDGQGYAHPRRMGLATHLGIVLERPTIGCAKSRLMGTHADPGKKQGSWSALVDPKASKERIGTVLRTRSGVSPIYVSQGHRVSMATAVRLTLKMANGFRIPQPTRDADRYAAEIKRGYLLSQLSEK
jgi:deoxyribonuclease V